MAGEARNWAELPGDITSNILYRVGVVDILDNAQKVCTTWRKVCKDPAMWRVIEMDFYLARYLPLQFEEMCMNAVERSEGQLVDISIVNFCSEKLLGYIADRSFKLKRLQIVCYYLDVCLLEALKKLPFLEELSIYGSSLSEKAIETIGLFCPMLKTLKANCITFSRHSRSYISDTEAKAEAVAVAIGKHLPNLRHLEVIGNPMSDSGLQVILGSCRHLESLDLRRCDNINLDEDLKKRCLKQIKYLRWPNDSLEDCPYDFGGDDDDDDDGDFNSDFGCDYDNYSIQYDDDDYDSDAVDDYKYGP